MKKLILPLSLFLLGFTGFATTASAQRYEARVEGPRIDGPRLDGPRLDGPRIVLQEGRDGRLANDLNRLNRQLRIVRGDLRGYGAGRRIRSEFFQIERAADRLNSQFRQGIGRRGEIRRQTDQLRYSLDRLQQELRSRAVRRGGRR